MWKNMIQPFLTVNTSLETSKSILSPCRSFDILSIFNFSRFGVSRIIVNLWFARAFQVGLQNPSESEFVGESNVTMFNRAHEFG